MLIGRRNNQSDAIFDFFIPLAEFSKLRLNRGKLWT